MKLLKYINTDVNSMIYNPVIYNTILLTNNGTKLSISVTINTIEYSKDIDLTNTHPGLYDLIISNDTQEKTIKLYKRFDYVSKYSNIVSNIADTDINFARLYIDSDTSTSDMLLLTYETDKEYTDFTQIEIDKKYSTTYALSENSENFKDIIDSYMNKSNMINEIDPYDSISYLEAQVDLLTRIVLNEVDADKLSLYKSDLEQFDKNSVLNIKSNDSILKENEHKANVRKYQEEYIAKKNTN